MSTKAKFYNRMKQGGSYIVDSTGAIHVLTTVSYNPENPEAEETLVHEYNIYTRSNSYPFVQRPLTRVGK